MRSYFLYDGVGLILALFFFFSFWFDRALKAQGIEQRNYCLFSFSSFLPTTCSTLYLYYLSNKYNDKITLSLLPNILSSKKSTKQAIAQEELI